MDRYCLGLTTNTISPARHEEASSSEHTVGLEACVGSVQSLHASPMQRLGIISGVRIRQLWLRTSRDVPWRADGKMRYEMGHHKMAHGTQIRRGRRPVPILIGVELAT